MVDREDDLKVGIKSTAILFGRYDLLIIALLQLFTLILLSVAGLQFGRGWFFGSGLVVAALYFVKQHIQAKRREPAMYFESFLNNHKVGLVVFIALALDYQLLG